jgi:hypothetical protein
MSTPAGARRCSSGSASFDAATGSWSGCRGGGARSFLVERVERRPKTALPTRRIWSRTRRPVLRLITCGGGFDRSTGHYRDNVIVHARAAS